MTDLIPFIPPSHINLTNVSTEGLTFEWNSVAPNCSAVSYTISSLGCGSCPSSTSTTSIICHGVQLNGESDLCTLSIQAVTCGNISGSFSNPLNVSLKGLLLLVYLAHDSVTV